MLKNITLIIILSFFAFVNVSIAESKTSSTNKEMGIAGDKVSDSKKTTDENSLKVSAAWARASYSSNSNSAAYMSINNPTDAQITILGASSMSAANNVELHKSFVDELGVSRMTSIDKIVVPSKSIISLAPGGIHIMLFDLKKALKIGDKFKITLDIEDSYPVIVDVKVK